MNQKKNLLETGLKASLNDGYSDQPGASNATATFVKAHSKSLGYSPKIKKYKLSLAVLSRWQLLVMMGTSGTGGMSHSSASLGDKGQSERTPWF